MRFGACLRAPGRACLPGSAPTGPAGQCTPHPWCRVLRTLQRTADLKLPVSRSGLLASVRYRQKGALLESTYVQLFEHTRYNQGKGGVQMGLVVRSAKFARTRPRRLHGQCASLMGTPGLHDAKGHCVEKPGMGRKGRRRGAGTTQQGHRSILLAASSAALT